MPTNLVADPTLASAIISSDGTLVQNTDGSWRVDFDGSGGSWMIVPLSAALVPLHEYNVGFGAEGTPHNLKGQLFQDAGGAPPSFGSPPNLWAAGTYSANLSFSAPNGTLKIWNYVASGQAFSVEGSSISVVDLDAA